MKPKLKFGNHKLGSDTAIFNMGTAKECPARKLGLCDVINRGIRCYAEKAELQYPRTVPIARKKQEEYWKSTPKEIILLDIGSRILSKKGRIKYLRFNESGDFW